MKAAVWLRTLGVVAAIALAAMLWRYGSGLCNESCSSARTTSMILLCAALPASLAWAAFAFTASPQRALPRAASSVLVMLLAGWAIFLSASR